MTVSIVDLPIQRVYAHVEGTLCVSVAAFYHRMRALGLTVPLGHWLLVWYANLENAGVQPSELVVPSDAAGMMTIYIYIYILHGEWCVFALAPGAVGGAANASDASRGVSPLAADVR